MGVAKGKWVGFEIEESRLGLRKTKDQYLWPLPISITRRPHEHQAFASPSSGNRKLKVELASTALVGTFFELQPWVLKKAESPAFS